MTLTLAFEIGLCLLLVLTIVYCGVLERRLKLVRQGQSELQSTISELNASLATAGASLRALQATAGTIGEELDRKISAARGMLDELSLVTASGERIAQRIERSIETVARPAVTTANINLPSTSIMNRLDALRAVR